jgi:ABC-type lipoprotein release transport system permease subunit
MFYKKRETEFTTLRAMGATLKEIGGIHLVSGVLIFIVSFIANFAMSRLLCFFIYKTFGRLLPELGVTGLNVPFDSFVPVSTVIIYAVVSALCGILSSIIPYLLYRRKMLAAEKSYIEQTLTESEENHEH